MVRQTEARGVTRLTNPLKTQPNDTVHVDKLVHMQTLKAITIGGHRCTGKGECLSLLSSNALQKRPNYATT